MPHEVLQRLWQHFNTIKAKPTGWIWFHWSWSRSKGYVCGEQEAGFSLLCIVIGARWELASPVASGNHVPVCECEWVTSGLECVWEWWGGEFSREDCAGRRAVSIIQGKHWAAWLHSLDVTRAGRTEMDEMMRLLLACMPAQLCSWFLLCSGTPRRIWEGYSQHQINLWVALLGSVV